MYLHFVLIQPVGDGFTKYCQEINKTQNKYSFDRENETNRNKKTRPKQQTTGKRQKQRSSLRLRQTKKRKTITAVQYSTIKS